MNNTGGIRNPKREEQGRITVYDWLRLIATIYVVVGHSAYLSIATTYGGVSYELPANLNSIYNSFILHLLRQLSVWVYGFHMPLFFMLSGAVFAVRPIASFDKIISSKIKRLLIPYFVYGWLFMIPIKMMGNFYNKESIVQAFNGFLSGTDSGHLWFLTSLFWCILAFVCIKKILEKINITSIYAVFIISGVVYFTYSYITFDVLGLKNGLSNLIYFSMGYIFEMERRTYNKWNIKEIALTVIILIILEVLNQKLGILNKFFAIIVGSFLTYLLADIADRIWSGANNNKLWNFVINNLFYVYLFHDPLNYIVLRIFMSRDLLSSAVGCMMFTFTRIVLIFIISLILGQLVTYIKQKITLLL